MKVIRPFTVNDTTLASTSVAETDAAYSAGTTYALGAAVRSDATHRRYESLQSSNTGHSLDDPAWWLDLGPTNPWAMFDQTTGTQTTDDDEIVVALAPGRRTNSVALLNVTGESVRVQVETEASGSIYDESYSLRDATGINSWFAYMFNAIVQDSNLIVTDLPIDYEPTITVTLDNSGGTAAIGSLIVGYVNSIGASLYSPSIGIVDYSRKTTDDYGNYTLVRRAFSQTGNFKIRCDNANLDAVVTLLNDLRSTPCVWIMDDETGQAFANATTIFGFYKDWSIDIPYLNYSLCNLQIEGLT